VIKLMMMIVIKLLMMMMMMMMMIPGSTLVISKTKCTGYRN
jgi:hypothetical protein